MKTASLHLTSQQFDGADLAPLRAIEPQLVLVFFSIAAVRQGSVLACLQQAFKDARLVGCDRWRDRR